MFHIFASSISLLANGVMEKKNYLRRTGTTLQAMELDCFHPCGNLQFEMSVIIGL